MSCFTALWYRKEYVISFIISLNGWQFLLNSHCIENNCLECWHCADSQENCYNHKDDHILRNRAATLQQCLQDCEPQFWFLKQTAYFSSPKICNGPRNIIPIPAPISPTEIGGHFLFSLSATQPTPGQTSPYVAEVSKNMRFTCVFVKLSCAQPSAIKIK